MRPFYTLQELFVREQRRKIAWMTLTIILALATLFLLWANQDLRADQPRLLLQKTVLEEYDDGYLTTGSFSQARNLIVISAKTPTGIGRVYHEYGHWIYTRMTEEEREGWRPYCEEMGSPGEERYSAGQWCSEWFARTFVEYVSYYSVNWTDDLDDGTSWVGGMFEKYVD